MSANRKQSKKPKRQGQAKTEPKLETQSPKNRPATQNSAVVISSPATSLRAPPKQSRWTLKYFIEAAITFAGLFGVLIGLDAIYFQLYPLISVESLSSTCTDKFQDTKFTITNESPESLYDVEGFISCWDGGHTEKNTIEANAGAIVPVLESKVATTIKMTLRPANQSKINVSFDPDSIEKPMILVGIDYTPFRIAFFKTRTSRLFYGYKTKNGIYAWCPLGSGASIRFADGRPSAPDP